MNHIFIDYENLKNIDTAVLGIERATFTILFGPQDTSLKLDVVESLIGRAGSVELVRIEKQAKNAVDFALAYYLGRKVAGDPAAFFHIVSKDTDYGPLKDHLKSRHINVSLHKSFTTVAAAINPKQKNSAPST